MRSLIEAFANQTWCQFVQRRPVVSDLRSCYRRMPSSLRTTRTQTAPTTRHKGTRSFPGLHAADELCPDILAGVCIRYMRVRVPVAHKGEWRPKRRAASKTTKAAAGGEFRKNNIEVFLSLYIIYTIRFILNSKKFQKKSARPPKMGQIVKRKSHKAQMGSLVGPVPYKF